MLISKKQKVNTAIHTYQITVMMLIYKPLK